MDKKNNGWMDEKRIMDGWMDEKRIMDGRGIEKIMDGWMKNGL
jgi:hypothetical protein